MKKYILKESFGPSNFGSMGQFSISEPAAINNKKNNEWFKKLWKNREEKNLFTHQRISLKKNKTFCEIIINSNQYISPSYPTILIKNEKKIKNIYIYTDIYARNLKISNFTKKKIGKFKIEENKLAIYEPNYISYINSPDIPKYAKNLKISVEEWIKRLKQGYLEIKTDNGIYDIYEISEKKAKLKPELSLIMDEHSETFDDQLIVGCCLRLKK